MAVAMWVSEMAVVFGYVVGVRAGVGVGIRVRRRVLHGWLVVLVSAGRRP